MRGEQPLILQATNQTLQLAKILMAKAQQIHERGTPGEAFHQYTTLASLKTILQSAGPAEVCSEDPRQ